MTATATVREQDPIHDQQRARAASSSRCGQSPRSSPTGTLALSNNVDGHRAPGEFVTACSDLSGCGQVDGAAHSLPAWAVPIVGRDRLAEPRASIRRGLPEGDVRLPSPGGRRLMPWQNRVRQTPYLPLRLQRANP